MHYFGFGQDRGLKSGYLYHMVHQLWAQAEEPFAHPVFDHPDCIWVWSCKLSIPWSAIHILGAAFLLHVISW